MLMPRRTLPSLPLISGHWVTGDWILRVSSLDVRRVLLVHCVKAVCQFNVHLMNDPECWSSPLQSKHVCDARMRSTARNSKEIQDRKQKNETQITLTRPVAS